MTKQIKNVFERNQYDLVTAAKKSRSWFEQQVNLLAKQRITPPQVLTSDPDQLVSVVVPGNLYLYLYDPKLKETLPYYDRFPLVFPFSKTEDGFIGLNMHYLPYQLRMVLLDRLLVFKTNKKMDDTTRLKYSWATIDGISKFAAAQPCVKRYLNGHIRSKFRKIDSNDWGTAMLLPVERFAKANKEVVWQDSKRIMRR